MIIQNIPAEETHPVRHQILRPHQTIDDCKYPLDYEHDTLHLGVFTDKKIVSVASFFKEQNSKFKVKEQYRLRGMATLTQYRNKQAGSSLIVEAEKIMKDQGTQLWWCNARTTVNEYYAKLGMQVLGDVFDIQPIGPHVLMFKDIS